MRQASGLAVSAAIMLKIASCECLSQGPCLAKGNREAFTGDSVCRPRSLTDQNKIAAHDGSQATRDRHRALGVAGGEPVVQARTQCRKLRQTFVKRREAPPRNEGNAYFVRSNRRYIGLGRLAPVNLDKVRPRLDAEMLPQTDAALVIAATRQTRPGAHARILAVCSHNPSTAHVVTIDVHCT